MSWLQLLVDVFFATFGVQISSLYPNATEFTQSAWRLCRLAVMKTEVLYFISVLNY